MHLVVVEMQVGQGKNTQFAVKPILYAQLLIIIRVIRWQQAVPAGT